MHSGLGTQSRYNQLPVQERFKAGDREPLWCPRSPRIEVARSVPHGSAIGFGFTTSKALKYYLPVQRNLEDSQASCAGAVQDQIELQEVQRSTCDTSRFVIRQTV
jgi:hypothetical protein